MTSVLQARHLLPYALVLVLPFARSFRALRADRLATVFALVAIGLAVRSAILLASGYQARAVPGVQRIYQTWEPFLAGAIGLTLLAFVLAAPRVRLVHYLGLAASTVPVLFGFFRVAWVLLAILTLVVLVCVRGEGRRPRLVVGALLCVALLAAGGRLLLPSGSRYEHELASRAGQIDLGLDPYRSREYGTVWTEIRRHPLTGSGFGTEYRADWTIYRSWSHNAYEWFWWRLGLLGLASFAALLLGALGAGLRAARRLTGADRALAIGLVAGVGLTALAANLHENFENYQTNLFVALALAQLLALASRAREQEEAE
jgi:hypothetical protein